MHLLFIVVVAALYFVPSILAYINKKDNINLIVGLNLFLGWSIIFWFIALYLALRKNVYLD